jgi:hypothetical protein
VTESGTGQVRSKKTAYKNIYIDAAMHHQLLWSASLLAAGRQ